MMSMGWLPAQSELLFQTDRWRQHDVPFHLSLSSASRDFFGAVGRIVTFLNYCALQILLLNYTYLLISFLLVTI